jgi:hypothetical protein
LGPPVDLAIGEYFAIDIGRLAAVAERSISGHACALFPGWRLGYFRRSTAVVCPGIYGFESQQISPLDGSNVGFVIRPIFIQLLSIVLK